MKISLKRFAPVLIFVFVINEKTTFETILGKDVNIAATGICFMFGEKAQTGKIEKMLKAVSENKK